MAEISVLNPLDTCRLCKKYLKNGPNGILTNTNAIFKKRPGSITIAARLERIGIYVTPCLDKSMRLCRSCYRKMAHVESAFETLRLWKAAMGVPTSDVTFEPNTNINSATLKRQREPSPGRGGDGKKPRLSKILARKSTVEILIKYPSGKAKNKIVSPEVSGMIDHLAYENWQVFAKFALEHKRTSTAIRKLLHKKVERETKALTENFILKKTSLEDLKDFSYGAMEKELSKKLPWFYTALNSVTGGSTIHNCVAASVALRSRDPRFSALALVINSVIKHGGAKAMFKKLSQMGITTASTSKQRELLAASGRKKELICWRPDCERHYQHLVSGEVCRRLTAEEVENLRDTADEKRWKSALKRVENELNRSADTEKAEIVEVNLGLEEGEHLKEEEDCWSEKEGMGYEERSWPPMECGGKEDIGADEQGVGGEDDNCGAVESYSERRENRNEASPQRDKDVESQPVKEEGETEHDCPSPASAETENWGLQLTCDSD